MSFELRLRGGDDVRILWVAAVVIVCVGFFYVNARYQSEIGRSHERAETLYRQTVSDERVLRDAASLRATQERALNDLRHIAKDASLSATTADLLATLHGSASQFGTHVVQLQPGGAEAEPAPVDKSADVPSTSLQATAFTIRIQGRFRSIVRFIEDLSHHATLINVASTEIALSNGVDHHGPEPMLDATIHATLYRLHVPEQGETRIAAAR
jgi:Tfp pilus assembly protein PilO